MKFSKYEMFAVIFSSLFLVSWAIVPYFMSVLFSFADVGFSIILITIGLTYNNFLFHNGIKLL